MSKVAWGSIPKTNISLNNIMSEQVAQKIAEEEDKLYAFQMEAFTQNESRLGLMDQEELDEDLKLALKLDAELNGGAHMEFNRPKSTEEDADLALAMQLQAEFNSQFNREVSAMESHWNAKSKVTVSYQNYLIDSETNHSTPDPKRYGADDEPDSEDESISVKDDREKEKRVRRKKKNKPSASEKREITTKHDVLINSKKNAKKAEELPLIAVGDTSNLRIPYTVFNSLKKYAMRAESIHESRGKTRLFDKDDFATEDKVFDKKTKLIILQMINSGQIGGLEGIISTGKEANVYLGTALIPVVDEKNRQTEEQDFEQDCAVKIFKTTLNEFKNRESYIREDHRFKDKVGKENSGKLIQMWAQKELSNLHRLQSIGIRCPEVLFFEKHVLVMTLIGKDGKAAPKLRDIARFLSESKKSELYQQCVEAMRVMYQKAGLIHADLSEYNTLYHEGNLWIIDVSQSVEKDHPKSRVFLYRDCHNINKYFTSIGVETISDIELFSLITMETITSQSTNDIINEVRNFIVENLGSVEIQETTPIEEMLEKIVPKSWNELDLNELSDDE